MRRTQPLAEREAWWLEVLARGLAAVVLAALVAGIGHAVQLVVAGWWR